MSTEDEQIVKVDGTVSAAYEQSMECIAVYAEYDNQKPSDRPCTLLIAPEGSTQVPRVWTEGEVRAIAMAAINMIRSAAKTGIHVGQACGYIGKACLDAGIILDPTL